MKTVFITGANRGIGLEFARQYAQDNFKVLATYLPSAPKDELDALVKAHPAIVTIPLDITNEEQIIVARKQLKDTPIDILINNAGILLPNDNLATVTLDTMVKVYTVNTVGPLLVTKHFYDLVAKSDLKTIVSISSRMGTMSFAQQQGSDYDDLFAYRASKAALNVIMSRIAVDLLDQGVKVLLFHPGHVATQLGGSVGGGAIKPTTSVTGMRKVIKEAPRSLKHYFYNYDGTPHDW